MDGQFFPGQLFQFEDGFVAPPVTGGGGGYSFNMTSGSGGGATGYDTGYNVGTFGSINAEPIPGHALLSMIKFGGDGIVAFQGDCVALLTGKLVYVGGIPYAFDAYSWTLESGDTWAEWDTGVPNFTGTQFIEIK